MHVKRLLKKGLLYTAFVAATTITADFGLRAMYTKKHALSSHQLEKAKEIFGNTIDYNAVRLSEGPISLLQQSGSFMANQNFIYAPTSTSFHELDSGSIFLHEMTHIWQGQNNIDACGLVGAADLWLNSPDYADAYNYDPREGSALTDYNFEQQADIVRDYYIELRSIRQLNDSSLAGNVMSQAKLDIIIEGLAKMRRLRSIIDKTITQPEEPSYVSDFEKKIAEFGRQQKKLALALEKQDFISKARDIYIHQSKAASPVDTVFQISFSLVQLGGKIRSVAMIIYNAESVAQIEDGLPYLYRSGDWEKEFEKLYAAIPDKDKIYTSVKKKAPPLKGFGL